MEVGTLEETKDKVFRQIAETMADDARPGASCPLCNKKARDPVIDIQTVAQRVGCMNRRKAPAATLSGHQPSDEDGQRLCPDRH